MGNVCNASRYMDRARCNLPCSAYRLPSCRSMLMRAFSCADLSRRPWPSNFEPSRKILAASLQRPTAISDTPIFKYATENQAIINIYFGYILIVFKFVCPNLVLTSQRWSKLNCCSKMFDGFFELLLILE